MYKEWRSGTCNKVCVGIKAEEACNTTSQCDPNLYCANGKCTKLLQKGLVSKVGAGLYAVGGVIAEKAHQMGIDDKIKQVSSTISEKVSQIEVNPAIKNAGVKTIEVAKKTGEFIVDQSKKVYNSEVVQNLAKKAEEQYVNIKQKANEYMSKQNESQQQVQNVNPIDVPQMSQVSEQQIHN